MRFSSLLYATAFSVGVLAQNNNERQGGNRGGGGQNGGGGGGGGGGADSLTLDAANVQTTGDGGNGGVANPGQALSKTSKNNFINNCSGKKLTNGLQVQEGSCNGIRKSAQVLCESNTNEDSNGRYSVQE